MQNSDFTVPVYYLHQIADQIRDMGGDMQRWLEGNQVHETQLDDAELRLPYATFRQLILDAMAMTQEPAFGLLVGERLLVNTHGILGYAAISSGTVRQTVELFERYVAVRTPLVSICHEVDGTQFRVKFEEPNPLGDIRRPVLEAAVLTIKNVLDYVAMGACRVSEVAFPFEAPGYAALATDLFKSDVRFSQSWAGFSVPLEMVDLPLKMADSTTFKEAASICQRELEKLAKDDTLGAKVRRVMLERKNGFPSLNVVARLFHLTPRTLHRRLLEEGTSFKDILEEVRHTIAVGHLKSDHLTIQEIAYLLGYSDLANFRRAFKRWEGTSPSAYRSCHAGH
jgi:AraC-like DNA-binding protein